MADLHLSFVGTGNAFAPGGLCWNGFVVNGRYLFEAPPSALMALHRVGIDPNALDAVLVSHHHGDHFLGLPSLLLHWKYQGRDRPITIIGPPRTKELAYVIGRSVYPGVFENDFGVEWIELAASETVQLGELHVEAVEVVHDTKLSLNLGYRCEIRGRRFAYTGDTTMCDAVLDLAQSSEVLVSECASRDGQIPIHMNLVDDIPTVRRAMHTDSTLILTHLSADVDDHGLANTIVAEDLATYRF